jgi:hypothetical protein
MFDIGNGIAGAADDVADFTVDAVDATVDAAGDVSIVIVNGLTTVGNLANGAWILAICKITYCC